MGASDTSASRTGSNWFSDHEPCLLFARTRVQAETDEAGRSPRESLVGECEEEAAAPLGFLSSRSKPEERRRVPLMPITGQSVLGGPCHLWHPVICWICPKVGFSAEASTEVLTNDRLPSIH